MKLDEIVHLIKIRDYLSQSINNFSIRRESINDLNFVLNLVDKKLVVELTQEEFKKTLKVDQK